MSEHTITEFLEARIAEDEAMARAATDAERPGTHWQWVTYETDVVVAPGDEVEAIALQDISLRSVEEFPTASVGVLPAFIISRVDEMQEGAGAHIARHDPARVLAECAAKRAIIAAHPIVDDVVEVSTRIKHGFACETCFSYGDIVEDNGYCDTLRALAAVYADHEDYRQEWAL